VGLTTWSGDELLVSGCSVKLMPGLDGFFSGGVLWLKSFQHILGIIRLNCIYSVDILCRQLARGA